MPKKTDMPPSAIGPPVRTDESRPGLRANALRRTRHSRDIPHAVSSSCSKAGELALQLLLDPHVTSVEFLTSLSFSGREVPVEMFVAELDDGSRVSFDIIDERAYRDLDADGLLLLTLKSHSICIIEVDRASIDSQPRANNTCRLWSYRDHQVPVQLRAAIDRALASGRRLTIRSLANIIGLHDPIPTIGALVSQGVLAVDLSRPLRPHSLVGRRSDRWPVARRPGWFGKDGQ
ncbi:hypothetical protein ABIE86_000099 [Bradyrhizobium diazoefficiens]